MAILEEIKEYFPYYLTEPAKLGIIKALEDFPSNMKYYTSFDDGSVLQGDGWDQLEVINFKTVEKKAIKGIILSNSCDISPENIRDLPAKLVFAPLIPLEMYRRSLKQKGVTSSRIDSKVNSIKEQKVTSLFYLPKGGNLDEDHIAVLDDLHSLPTSIFFDKPNRNKQFTLSQAGFYLFLFKLSIHFCRFHENVTRDFAES